MSHLRSSHSVSLPLQKDSLTSERKKHSSRRNRKTVFPLRGDESPAVELPPLPRWMINTPINSKFPMIPAPKGKIVLFTTDLCQTRHLAPSALEFDPSAQGVSSTYQSLHDPHLKNHYWQSESFDRLVRGGFVTTDGKVKCTLKEFNDFQQYLKRVRLEKMNQEQKLLLEIEQEEEERRRYNQVKTANQLAHEKRIEDAQKRSRKKNKDRQKRLKQQLDAYDAKHACIITEQCLRREIDEVKRELEEQRRLNHKLQVEKEEHEKKIVFLRKGAKEARQRAKRLEERVVTKRENQEKLLEEKWDRKMLSKDSGFASEYLHKLQSSSKLSECITSRKRKLELGWLKQQADLARISEARMKKAAEEETKITVNLEKKLSIIGRKFERKLKKLQAMLRSGGIPPVVQLKETHRFAERKIEWKHLKEEMKLQREREIELQKKMKRRQRALEKERRERERERARAASVPPLVTCVEILDEPLPLVTIASHPSWGEAMSEVGLCAEILPPIPVISGGGEDHEVDESEPESVDEEEEWNDTLDDGYEEEQIRFSLAARDFVNQSMERAVARNIVQTTVENAIARDIADASLEQAVASKVVFERAASASPQLIESESSYIMEEIESKSVIRAESKISEVAELQDTPSIVTARELVVDAIGGAHDELDQETSVTEEQVKQRLGDTPSVVTAKQLTADAIGGAYDEMDQVTSVTHQQKVKPTTPQRKPFRKTPSAVARTLAEWAMDDVIGDMTSGGSIIEGALVRQTSSHIGRGLAHDAIEDSVYEVSQEEYELRQTPSNIGGKLAHGVVVDAVDELDQIIDAKLCVVFRDIPKTVKVDKTMDIEKPEEVDEVCPEESPKPSEIEIVEDVHEICPEVPKQTPSVLTARDSAKLAIGDAMSDLQDISDNYLSIDRVICTQTSSEIARGLADNAVEDAALDIKQTEGTEIETAGRKTPSNLGRKLAKGAVARAKDDIQESSKLYKARKRSFYRSKSVESDDALQPTTKSTELPSEDRVVGRQTPSQLARDLTGKAVLEAAIDIKNTEGTIVETGIRHTPSNLARQLAKGAIAGAKNDLEESPKLDTAIKKSFYISQSVKGDVTRQPTTKPKETRSGVSRLLAKGALEDATNDLEQEGHTVEVVRRKTPSNLARDLAETTIKEVAAGLESDEVMHVIYRKTPSNLARALAEDVMLDAATDFEGDGECVVISLRKTPSNVARSLAKVAVGDAVQEIKDQTEYTVQMPVRKTPSNMGRGLVRGVLSDAVMELEREGKHIDGTIRSSPSNVARNLVQSAVDDAGNELDRQSPIYILPVTRRKTPSDIARSVTDDAMTEAVGEFRDGGHVVDWKSRKTPSNLAREITGSVINDAEAEIETGPPEYQTYQIQGKTSSNIAREVVVDALTGGIDDIEGEGKPVEGILRKTPSNLGRVLAKDVLGEALGELDKTKLPPAKVSRKKLTQSLVLAQDLTAEAIHGGISDTSTTGVDEFAFNEDDFTEMWGNASSILGNSSVLIASVMDVFSGPIAPVASGFDEDDEDEEEEEVIGFLENALIAENEPILLNSDPILTEVVHYTDDNKAVVEGAVKISSDDGIAATRSVTEAALSMQSLTKNDSGQLIRESSSSSAAEEPTSPPVPRDDSIKGPQYFKLIPLYNNKSIDVGDDVIKSNLQAISIKPDPIKGIAGKHHPQSRNSFRNIFRPDMTHCEGSARCLKDTLVTQLCQEAGVEQNTAVLDECCKLLDEEQEDITAKHSDEELVKIGDVEGVCMWPKAQQRAYKAHVIDEPVPEKAEEEDISIDQNGSSECKRDEEERACQKESTTKNDENSITSPNTTSKKSSSLLNTLVNKISSVFKRRSNDAVEKELAQNDRSDKNHDESDGSNAKPTLEESKLLDDNSVEPDIPRPDHKHNDESNKTKPTMQTATEDACKSRANASSKQANMHENEGQMTACETDCVFTDAVADSQKHIFDDTKCDEKGRDGVLDDRKQDVDTKITAHEDRKIEIDNIDDTVEKIASEIKSSSLNSKKSSQKSINISESSSLTKRNKSSVLISDKNSKKSIKISDSSSSMNKKKSGVSIIYVKPAIENKLSRSSCTVLVAGKSITSLAEGRSRSNGRLKTPEDARRRSSRAVLHEVKHRKGSETRCSSATTESEAQHVPVANIKAESEDAGLREYLRQSQTAMRKLSQQALPPKSSHRIMLSTSYSACELDGRGSKAVGSSEISDETNKDAMWPISTISSECDSEWAEEGMRTPKELSSPPDTDTKPSPRACDEQLDLKQHKKKHSGGKLSTESKEQKATDSTTKTKSDHQYVTTEHALEEHKDKPNRDITVAQEEDNLNNSADKEEEQHNEVDILASSCSPVQQPIESRQHSGIISNILSRVFSIGRVRVNQVTPVTVDDDGEKNNADELAPEEEQQ